MGARDASPLRHRRPGRLARPLRPVFAALAAAFVLSPAPAAAFAARTHRRAGRGTRARAAGRLHRERDFPMSGDGRVEATVPMGDSRLVFGATGLAPVVLVVHATERGTSGRRLVFPDIVLGAGVDLIGEVVDALGPASR